MDRSKNYYEIYEIIENENLIIEILEINFNNPNIILTISITNKKENTVLLEYQNFLVLDSKDKFIPFKSNLRETPPFIPPFQRIIFDIHFGDYISDFAKLWFNIGDTISNKSFIIEPWVRNLFGNRFSQDELIKSDPVYLYNFLFKFNLLDNIYSNYKNYLPKIDNEVIEKLIYDIDSDYIEKYESMFDSEAIVSSLSKNGNHNLRFAIKHLSTNEFKNHIKSNFENIEKNILNQGSLLLYVNNKEDYMDDEIIKKIVEWSIVYAKTFKEWHYPYIDDDFFKKNRQVFKNLDLRNSLLLFKTNLSPTIVNSILITKDLGDFPVTQFDNIKKYYDKITDDTIEKIKSNNDKKAEQGSFNIIEYKK